MKNKRIYTRIQSKLCIDIKEEKGKKLGKRNLLLDLSIQR